MFKEFIVVALLCCATAYDYYSEEKYGYEVNSPL